MTIECPNCQASYTIDPKAKFAIDQVLKCAKCVHLWTVSLKDIDEQTVESHNVKEIDNKKTIVGSGF